MRPQNQLSYQVDLLNVTGALFYLWDLDLWNDLLLIFPATD